MSKAGTMRLPYTGFVDWFSVEARAKEKIACGARRGCASESHRLRPSSGINFRSCSCSETISSSMSRSIHMTRRALAQLRAQDFADLRSKADRVRAARNALRRKWRIKEAIRDERKDRTAPETVVSPALVPIVIEDSSNCVHYPLGEADLRSLVEALPAAAVEGIRSIQLCLGREYMDERSDREDHDARDPFTGRLACKIFPGIYCGTILGTYSPNSGNIALYAYVYDEVALNELPLPRLAVTGYLRLHALKTLIHEVAHHHDNMVRVGRGRWLAVGKYRVENYAERMEYEWTEQIGLEWLEGRFPLEMHALRNWVEEFGGARVPLHFFAGDPRVTARDGSQRLSCGTDTAFECFVAELAKKDLDVPSTQKWLSFAQQVHYVDEYDLCLRIVDRILAQEPCHFEAQICKADTCVHLERFAEAIAMTDDLLARAPDDSRVWNIRADVFEARHQWDELLHVCRTWEASVQMNWKAIRRISTARATAYCATERYIDMEYWIGISVATIPGVKSYDVRRRVKSEDVRRLVFFRAGKPLPPAAR